MHPKLRMYLETRADAARRGDFGVVRSITADLDRIGYRDPISTPRDDAPETTVAPELPERAVPAAPAKTRAPKSATD